MRRKFFTTIWFAVLILAGVLMTPPQSRAGDEPEAGFSSYGLVSKLAGSSSDDIFKTMFVSEASAGKDLYNAMLVKAAVEPTDDTLKLVAQKWGFTLTEALQTLNGDPSPLLQKSSYMTVERAYERLAQFKDDYDRFLEIIKDQKKLENEISMIEIFANGDISDSGFDLVYDLDVIEKILFLKVTDSDVYTGDQPTSEKPGPQKGDEIKSEFTPYPYGGTTMPEGAKKQAEPSEPAEEKPESKSEPEDEFAKIEEVLKVDDKVDRDSCNKSAEFTAALDDFDKNSGGETTSVSGAAAASGAATAKTDQVSKKSGTASSPAGADINDFSNQKKQTPAAAEKDKKDASGDSSWLKEKDCKPGDFICMKLEFIYKQASSYNDSDNCIACHVEKINDSFEKTLRRSMLPSKATGNLFESGKCKKGFSLPSLINLNLIAVPMPPMPPANDDLIFFHSFEAEFDKFLSRYVPESIAEVLGAEEGERFSTVEQTTLSEVQYSNAEQTMTELFQNVRSMQEEAERQVAEQMETLEKSENIESKAEFFRAIGTEIDQMNMYFNSFKYIFEQIKEPCYQSANKGDVQ